MPTLTGEAEAGLTRRWLSPMMRNILLVNALPLVLLAVTVLYLNQFHTGLLQGEVGALREQARIYAGALGQSAVTTLPAPKQAARAVGGRAAAEGDSVQLAPDVARRLLRRLTEPSPSAVARLYAPDGQAIAGSAGSEHGLCPPPGRARRQGFADWLGGWLGIAEAAARPTERNSERGERGSERTAEHVLVIRAHPQLTVPEVSVDSAADCQPAVRERVVLPEEPGSNEAPPNIWRTVDGRLLVQVVEPVVHEGHTIGIVQLTREASGVDRTLFEVRASIFGLTLIALALTVLLSWYLSLTIARPILSLARAARVMRDNAGRTFSVPTRLRARRDEIGLLASTLDESAQALWTRMDAIERFAADVAHEIKNPLSSIRSAIETALRIGDVEQQKRLLTIIGHDVRRLDRLITDISDASRVDAELSRTRPERVAVAPILSVMAEMNEATREADGPLLVVEAESDTRPGREGQPLAVWAVEDRLVQVLRNLIGNAESFSPPAGRIWLRVAEAGRGFVSIAIEDEGPGIPPAKLESIFDRFYTERPAAERFGQHSGLGLSISRQIVTNLRGSLAAQNRTDASGAILGARFVVTLPRAF